MRRTLQILIALFLIWGCQSQQKVKKKAQQFLDDYNKKYQKLYYESAKAQWVANTKIVEGDTTRSARAKRAKKAFSRFTGSKENIKQAKKFLNKKNKLKDIQVKQLEKILYQAADKPQTVPQVVDQRVQAEVELNEKLYGFDFKVDTQSVTPNEIDEVLRNSNNLQKRLKYWRTSKEVGKALKPGLVHIRDLRNKTVNALDYDNFFSYEVSDYGMESKELLNLMEKVIKKVWPLYRQLHTYARYELAKKYEVDTVPKMLPAHWLPNRWGQSWSSMINVQGLNLDSALQQKSPEWIVKQGERFYTSMGFSELPQTFWDKSSLYPPPEDADYKKNNHASAWHLNLENDVRCLMSVIPNKDWYETSHHELGHIYYYIQYTNPQVPVILRDGANRGFHEAIGSLMELPAMNKEYLATLDLIPKNSKTVQKQTLLKQALNYIVFIPFGAGLMSHFEHQLYAKDLSENELNKVWWHMKKKYQGIVPPSSRGEQYCDAASKTHIINDPAQYYDYAISYILLFQFHEHIANHIIDQNIHKANYYKKKKIGEFLKKLMRPGATKDWRKLLKQTTGEGMTAEPMLKYFAPLKNYLKKKNKGRKHTLPQWAQVKSQSLNI